MKFAVNPADEVAFKRIARLLPGVAVKTAEKLWDQLSSVPESERRRFRDMAGSMPHWTETGESLATALLHAGRNRSRTSTGFAFADDSHHSGSHL